MLLPAQWLYGRKTTERVLFLIHRNFILCFCFGDFSFGSAELFLFLSFRFHSDHFLCFPQSPPRPFMALMAMRLLFAFIASFAEVVAVAAETTTTRSRQLHDDDDGPTRTLVAATTAAAAASHDGLGVVTSSLWLKHKRRQLQQLEGSAASSSYASFATCSDYVAWFENDATAASTLGGARCDCTTDSSTGHWIATCAYDCETCLHSAGGCFLLSYQRYSSGLEWECLDYSVQGPSEDKLCTLYLYPSEAEVVVAINDEYCAKSALNPACATNYQYDCRILDRPVICDQRNLTNPIWKVMFDDSEDLCTMGSCAAVEGRPPTTFPEPSPLYGFSLGRLEVSSAASTGSGALVDDEEVRPNAASVWLSSAPTMMTKHPLVFLLTTWAILSLWTAHHFL
jgi:hypothetical protein